MYLLYDDKLKMNGYISSHLCLNREIVVNGVSGSEPPRKSGTKQAVQPDIFYVYDVVLRTQVFTVSQQYKQLDVLIRSFLTMTGLGYGLLGALRNSLFKSVILNVHVKVRTFPSHYGTFTQN